MVMEVRLASSRDTLTVDKLYSTDPDQALGENWAKKGSGNFWNIHGDFQASGRLY